MKLYCCPFCGRRVCEEAGTACDLRMCELEQERAHIDRLIEDERQSQTQSAPVSHSPLRNLAQNYSRARLPKQTSGRQTVKFGFQPGYEE